MFSVIVPLFNKADAVVSCIGSILTQSFEDFEIIVVDNNSTDAGVKRVEEEIQDKRIKLVYENKQGVSFARNFGVSLAQYNYICFIDADDIWMPHHLEELKKLIDHFPEANLYSNAYKIVETNGLERNTEAISTQTKPYWFPESQFFDCFIKADMPIHTNTICIPKHVFEQVGGFDVTITYGEDVLLWAKIFLLKKVLIGNYIGAVYQRNAQNRSDIPHKLLKELPVIKKYEEIYGQNTEWQKASKKYKAFIAKHLFLTLMSNIKNGTLKDARIIFYDARIYALHSKLRLFIAACLAFTPVVLSKFLLKFLMRLNMVK
jgi:glycosyltransferase involved in cell wall biosynthesis